MPDFTSALKLEMSRIARKEMRTHIHTSSAAIASLRTHNRTLRKEVSDLKRELRLVRKELGAGRQTKENGAAAGPAPGRQRFTAKGLRSMRTKLGLSPEMLGTLIGVSGQSIRKWEDGSATPRKSAQEKIFAFRGTGKKEVVKRLEEMNG